MTPLEKMILSWVARVTSIMSFLGSSSMIYMIISDRQRKLTKSNHRLMLGLSVADCFQSAAYAFTTMAVPRGGTDWTTYGAIGNHATCSAQAFFIILGFGVPLYNTSLSIFYLLTIRHGVQATDFAKRFEPFMHIVSILLPLVSAITTVSTGAISPGPTVCYLSWDPEHAGWIWAGLLVLTTCFFICIYSMAAISFTVIRQRTRMRRYSYASARTEHRNSEISDTVKQALLYVAAFFLTFAFPCIAWVFREYSFTLEVLAKIFYPLQGFWNFLLYIRPGVKEARRANPDKSLVWILNQVIVHSKDRVVQTRRTRRNLRTPIQAIPDKMTHDRALEMNTDEVQSTSLRQVEFNQQHVISRSFSGEKSIPNEGSSPLGRYEGSSPLNHIDQESTEATISKDSGDMSIDNQNSLPLCMANDVHYNLSPVLSLGNKDLYNNSTSNFEADNLSLVRSLEDKVLEIETSNLFQSLSLDSTHSSGERSLKIQWDDLTGSANDYDVEKQSPSSKSASSFGSENKAKSEGIVNEGGEGFRAKRRVSLINLFTGSDSKKQSPSSKSSSSKSPSSIASDNKEGGEGFRAKRRVSLINLFTGSDSEKQSPSSKSSSSKSPSSKSPSSFASENKAKSEGIVNEGEEGFRAKRRVSLIDLSTIGSFYELDYDSAEDI